MGQTGSRRGSSAGTTEPSRASEPGKHRQPIVSSVRRASIPEIKVVKTQEEWKACLSLDAFESTRLGQDDDKDNGLFVDHTAQGVYLCICCEEPLFDSSKKYVSNVGYATFFNHLGFVSHRPLPDSNETKRNEAFCKRCDAHLGYVSMEGPPPTGAQFSINSSALSFILASEEGEVEISDARRRSEVMSPPPEDVKTGGSRRGSLSARRGSRRGSAPVLAIQTQHPGAVQHDELLDLQSPGAARRRSLVAKEEDLTFLQSPGPARRRSQVLETMQAEGIVYQGTV
jgi:peptide-methionine (R)-S-oxide reductase